MIRRALFVLLIYGSFVLAALALAASNPKMYAVDVHLTLLATGTPASFLSLYLPHGSIIGITVAGCLGFLQWVIVVEFDTWMKFRASKRDGA